MGFAWLAGAGLTTLSKCPDWEIRKHSVFGATVLVPTIFGAAASAYAVTTLSDNRFIIFTVAVIWALIVLTIDRAFLAAYRPGLPAKQKRVQFFLRFVIALLMGVTIAHPLVLMIFEGGIEEEIRSMEMERVDLANQKLAQQSNEIDGVITRLQDRQTELRTQYQDSFKPAELKANHETAQSDWSEKMAVLDYQISTLNSQSNQLAGELKKWSQIYQDEIEGNGKSATAGVGPEARRIEKDEINWRQERLTALTQSLTELTTSKTRLLSENDQTRNELRSAQTQSLIAEMVAQEKSRAFLREGLQSQLANLESEIEMRQITKNEIPSSPEIEPLKQDLMTRTLALHHLFGKEGGLFALLAYLVLSLVFVIMDTIPIVVKFSTKAGPYDLLIQHQEDNFIPELVDAPTVAEPVNRKSRIKPNPDDPRNRITSAWNKKRPHHPAQPRQKTDTQASREIEEADHVIVKARKLEEMRKVFRTNLELSQAVGITPTMLSKYFKLLKLPNSTQSSFASIPHLTLEIAYRIACLDSSHHERLLALYREGSGQKEIREAIADIKMG